MNPTGQPGDMAQGVNAVHQSPLAGKTCAGCGTFYHSSLALKQACVECGAPLCLDCWSRRKVRKCAAHDRTGAVPPVLEPRNSERM